MKKTFLLFIAIMMACTAQADILISAKQTLTKNGAQDGRGSYWNVSDEFGISNLVDTAGSGTGISIEWAGSSYVPLAGGNTGMVDRAGIEVTANASFGSAVSNSLLYQAGDFASGFYTPKAGETATLTFSGLTVGQSYTFSIWAARDTAGARYTKYTATGGGVAVSDILQVSGTGIGNGEDYNTDNLSVLTQTADGSGQIVISYFGSNNSSASSADQYGYINAIQVVPEPAVIGMLGLGALVSLVVRRIRG